MSIKFLSLSFNARDSINKASHCMVLNSIINCASATAWC